MVELEKEKLQQNSRMEELMQQNNRVMAAMLQKMGGVQPEAPESPPSAEVTPVKSKTEVVVPGMPGTGEKQAGQGNWPSSGCLLATQVRASRPSRQQAVAARRWLS